MQCAATIRTPTAHAAPHGGHSASMPRPAMSAPSALCEPVQRTEHGPRLDGAASIIERRAARLRHAEVTPQMLADLVSYNPTTGRFVWKERGPEWADCMDAIPQWNARYAGRPAFNGVVNGYFKSAIFGKKIFAHRAVWVMHYGEWPNGHIDHINGDTLDNRIENLRIVNDQENARNQKRRKNNASGVMGVSFVTSIQRWRAQIRHNGKRLHLGQFKTREEAIAVRKEAEERFGYHPNHGRIHQTLSRRSCEANQ